jgi:hypothetical protein
MKNHISAIIFGIAIVVAAYFLGNAYVTRYQETGEISVTGLGKQDFTSDLIVWEVRFKTLNQNLQAAYNTLNEQKKIIRDYLIEKGVSNENMVFNAVETNNRFKQVYGPNGNYQGQEFIGYELSQTVQIESKEVEKIEKVSREVTELLNSGLQVYSQSPRYYYTKLADLKLEMISKATEDARLRAEKIAENSGGQLGNLVTAKMGVFQITGQNSKEDYSWGGTFNTSAKEKTASITMKLRYSAE